MACMRTARWCCSSPAWRPPPSTRSCSASSIPSCRARTTACRTTSTSSASPPTPACSACAPRWRCCARWGGSGGCCRRSTWSGCWGRIRSAWPLRRWPPCGASAYPWACARTSPPTCARATPGKRLVHLAGDLLEGSYRLMARRAPTVVVGPELAENFKRARHLLPISVSLVRDSDIVDPEVAAAPALGGRAQRAERRAARDREEPAAARRRARLASTEATGAC